MLFQNVSQENLNGAAHKNLTLKKFIISYFAKAGNRTIAEICAEVELSATKINTVLTELIADGLVQDFWQNRPKSGRKPN